MEKIALVIVTALISGLFATIITLIWQKRTASYNRKMKIFETLMMYRVPKMIHFEESVRALNSIDVIFYKNANVRKAYQEFLNEAGKPQDMNPQLADKHLKLLEIMAESLGLKNLHWENIKRYYFPKGYEEQLKDSDMLRKASIMSNLESAKFVRGMNNKQEEMNLKEVEHDSRN